MQLSLLLLLSSAIIVHLRRVKPNKYLSIGVTLSYPMVVSVTKQQQTESKYVQPSYVENAVAPPAIVKLDKKDTTNMRLISVASVRLQPSARFACLITTDENLFSCSPMLWNMTRPSGMPTMAQNMVNNFPDFVFGVECP